ncbi:MAG: transketolase [Actinomycetota bacterium]|nr:transketolase [Actinomycetota bacterium]MDA3025881.1 transketolase [Actinomycetota bacterium]
MSEITWTDLDERSVNTARSLALDAVENAGHGHPGTAMALAPVAHLLFQKFMNHDPNDPDWFGRDRFILSCGHASMLLYAQLYLNGYGLEIEDLKNFRKLNSLTPGHPEYLHTKGVEMTTGPLGQGLSSGVGMAIASRYWRNHFDPTAQTGQSIFDNFIYIVASDGDLQEGVTSEASSIAGHLGLANLIVIYDDNQISIDGETNLAFTEDVVARYRAYNWDVHTVELGDDGQVNVLQLIKAINNAKASDKPSFIRLKTVIAWPAPNARNTAAAHGAPLGESETKLTKQKLGLDPEQKFSVPEDVLLYTRQSQTNGSKKHKEWNDKFKIWAKDNAKLSNDFQRLQKNELIQDLESSLTVFETGTSIASRKSGGTILNELSNKLIELVGGSADLAESNGVLLKNASSMQKQNSEINQSSAGGKYLHFGIREHAMASIMNGMALYGFTRPFGATFLIFSDYQKPAIRLASLMQLPVIYVWTHDSIGLGEDGPTHQPVEQLWALRSIPGFSVVRPADANEVSACWIKILEDRKPAGIVLTRQNIPTLDRKLNNSAQGAKKGGYILQDCSNSKPDVILIATGSEIELALLAQKELNSQSINTRVVSMPCVEWFQNESKSYQESVLPKEVKAKIAIEAGSTLGWYQFVGLEGAVIGLDHYGASGKPDLLYKEFGITVQDIVKKAKELKK